MRRFTSGEYLLAVTVAMFVLIWAALRYIVTPLIVR
jgi:hypothetical protein